MPASIYLCLEQAIGQGVDDFKIILDWADLNFSIYESWSISDSLSLLVSHLKIWGVHHGPSSLVLLTSDFAPASVKGSAQPFSLWAAVLLGDN